MRKLSKISLITIIISFVISNITPVYAFNNPVEGIFGNIATFFNFEMFSDGPMQIGFLRFVLWILLFAIINWAASSFVFKDANGKRTSGIVAAIISLISVIFMPTEAVLAIGVAYSAAIFTILIVGIAGVAVFISLKTLKGEPWKEILGILILVLAMMIMTVAGTAMGVF